MANQQVAKVVRRKDASVANAYKYARWVYRVVICLPEQHGYLNERGVELLWESDFVTRAGGPKDKAQQAEAARVAAEANRRLAVGLVPGTPDEIVADRELEVHP